MCCQSEHFRVRDGQDPPEFVAQVRGLSAQVSGWHGLWVKFSFRLLKPVAWWRLCQVLSFPEWVVAKKRAHWESNRDRRRPAWQS